MANALSNRHDAEEATQDVVVRVIEGLPRFRPSSGGFLAWAFAIAHNRAVDLRRARSRSSATDPAEMARAEERAGGAEAFAREPRDEHSALRELIAPLSLVQREVLTLIYEFDLAPERVGEVLGRSAASVRQEHARARRKLLEVVEAERRRLFGR